MFLTAVGANVGILDDLDDVLTRWIDAECRGDTAALDALLDGDFRGDGPRGYVLSKEQWLDRYRNGDLANIAFTWQDMQIRLHDHTAVVTGVQTQSSHYQGDDWSGRFRGTLVVVRRDGRWSLVNLQLSRMGDADD